MVKLEYKKQKRPTNIQILLFLYIFASYYIYYVDSNRKNRR